MNEIIGSLRSEIDKNRFAVANTQYQSFKPGSPPINLAKEPRSKTSGQLAIIHSQYPNQPPSLPIQFTAGFTKFHNQFKSPSMTQIQEVDKPDQQINLIKFDQIEAPSIMFTRLDAERNEKRLRRALTRGFLNDITFEVNHEQIKSFKKIYIF